jgi:ribose transport system substrate-binding protein
MPNATLRIPRAALFFLVSIALAIAGCEKGGDRKSGGDDKGGASGSTTGSTSSSSAADAGTKGVRRIVLMTNGNSPFWDACRAGMQSAAADLKLSDAGLDAVMEVNDGTPQGQLERLRQFGSQPDIVGVAMSAVDAKNVAVVEEMRALQQRGIHVTCMDGDVEAKYHDARHCYIGTDNVTGGKVLGVAAKNLLGARNVKSGGYVQFVGRLGAENAIERMGGFKETMAPEYSEVDRMEDNFDLNKARDNVRNAMINHPDLVALIGIWSYNAPAICDVVKQDYSDKRANLTIATFDAEPVAIRRMGEGLIDVMVVQDPYDIGYQSVRIQKALAAGDQAAVKEMLPNKGKDGGDVYETALKVVVPDDKSPLKAEVLKEKFGDKVKFMDLTEFKAWLAKYKLVGS